MAAISEIAHNAGAIVAVDNTLLSPFLLRPLSLGVDIVLHSATKYLCGHGDALSGVISGNSIHLKEAIMKMRTLLGVFLAPMNAYLVIRGIRTLPFRMKQHCQNARALAHFLNEHEKVTAVRYPPLSLSEASPQAKAQQSEFGALLGFTLAEGINPETVQTILEAVSPVG